MTDLGRPATPPGFATVDHDPDPGRLVVALDEQDQLPVIQRLRAAAADQLAPRPGQRLLDAGCGTGTMTRRLAELVAPDGAVVGIDASDIMLTEARRRIGGPSPPVEFRWGDVTQLDLADASFDGAYCERVFQHLVAPAAALAELGRVTRPGGRVVVVDSDWGMHAIHGADPALTRRVVATWAELSPNGWSGRRLPVLFDDAGLADAVVVTDTAILRELPPGREPFSTMAFLAGQTGALGADEARRWLDELVTASTGGSFLWAVTLFLVAATRP